MPRIFKGSESTLRLLISKTGDYQALTEIKIKLYTTDIENAIEIIDGIQVCKNIAIITLAPRAFMGMEDGLINYIIDGATEDDVFHTERQSNYMLKSLSYINEDGVATQTMTIESNGEYRVTPNDGLYVDINVNVPDLNGSYEQGKTDGVNEQKSKLVSINITENGTYTKEDGYNQIEVNVIPKINVKDTGLNFAYSKFTEVPEWADFEGITDMNNMFESCTNLQTIPQIDTSSVTAMERMFYGCGSLQTIPLLNTSNVTSMHSMFYYCSNLRTIPQIDTSKVTNMYYMFSYCSNLQTIPQIDTSNVNNMSCMFYNCNSLVSLPALNAQSLNMPSYYGLFANNEVPNLTDFGGLLNLKCSLESDYNFKKLPNLTYQSCINVLNGLYDFTGNGEVPNSEQGKLKVHQNFLDKVGNEISIGTNKGWQITA